MRVGGIPIVAALCSLAAGAQPQPNACAQPAISTVAPPAFSANLTADLDERPTNYSVNRRPLGALRAIMVFVDFSDARGNPDQREQKRIADNLLGVNKASDWFRTQSHGKMSLQVDRRYGWKRMPRPATEYAFRPYYFHRQFLSVALELFRNDHLNFSQYQIVYVVTARTAHFPDSPAFIATNDSVAVYTASGLVRHAVAFGDDSYSNSYTNLIHETNHLFGLPDLYRQTQPYYREAGGWDLMSDMRRSEALVGWHHYKLGWLEPHRRTFHRSGVLKTTLSPLSENCALAMVVVPAGRAASPSKVYAVELAQPDKQHLTAEGVLIYSVDSGVKTLNGPLVVRSKSAARPPLMNPDGAPFDVGSVFREGNLTVRVLRKIGKLYEVSIEVS
jgi:M6 family metalloprotease-like protein